MSVWLRICYKLLGLILKILVKSKTIPINPVLDLKIDVSKPILYILPYNSMVDLFVLRSQCLECNLPDPVKPLSDLGGVSFPRSMFICDMHHIFDFYKSKENLVKISCDHLNLCLNLHRNNKNLNVQMIPVSIIFGYCRNYQKSKTNLPLRMLNCIQKFFAILCFGRNSFIRFSQPISLRRICDKYGAEKVVSQKLMRVVQIHFAHQRLESFDSKLLTRKDLFSKLISSKAIINAIEYESRIRKISYEKAQQKATELIVEIAANFSYNMVRLFDRILGFVWSYLYQRINVYNFERVRQLALDGQEIVYAPCHRSHIDYFLLSYVLYQNGLVPPHIAAGINLDFWPIGPIFRYLGAFFIRRSFKSNKLYSTVFREYLGELFSQGYSIEYFIEGGRSRTGRLIHPKTGTLSMTVQAILRGDKRSIALVPICISYEHVMEVNSYLRELNGTKTEEKKSLLRTLCDIIKYRRLGQSYVNFGEPIYLTDWLNNYVPEWHRYIDPVETTHPAWLTPIVNRIAIELMVRINNASIVNAVNLCCMVLLSSCQYSLTLEHLIEQLECYLSIMRNIPYSSDSILPNATAKQLVDYVLQMNEFKVEKDTAGDIIILPSDQAILMTYYSNNIAHMLILPSLISVILVQCCKIKLKELQSYIEALYPMLKSELFLRWKKEELTKELNKLTTELSRQDLLNIKNDEISINPTRFHMLKMLATGASATLQRYAIVLWILNVDPLIDRNTLERESYMIARRLSMLHGVKSLEFLDKKIFNPLVLTLRNEGYISTGNIKSNKIKKFYQMIAKLITLDVRLTIENSKRQKI